jgi:hydroxypyruvate reductase
MGMKPEVLVVSPPMPEIAACLEAAYVCHHLWQAADRDGLLAAVGGSVRGVATDGGTGCPASMMRALPKLEIVAVNGVGVDAVDLSQARARGIAVTNTPDVLTDDVADLAIALMLMAERRLAAAERFLRAGQWLAGAFPLSRAAGGRKVGIVGMGRIGQAIARRLAVMGCILRWNGPRPKPDLAYAYESDLVALAAWAEVLIVICPGGPATRNLINSTVIAALGPEGTLVNVARGSVVDEAALVAALLEGRLGAAALDVFADEPRVPEALLSRDDVVLLPHVGSATRETRLAMGRLVVDNLAAHFAGRPLLTRDA